MYNRKPLHVSPSPFFEDHAFGVELPESNEKTPRTSLEVLGVLYVLSQQRFVPPHLFARAAFKEASQLVEVAIVLDEADDCHQSLWINQLFKWHKVQIQLS